MRAASKPVASAYSVLSMDLTSSELLLGKPTVLHIAAADTYLAVVALSAAGATCIFANGRRVTEQRLARDCLSEIGAAIAAKVEWHYTNQHYKPDSDDGLDDTVHTCLALQKKPRLPVFLYSDVAADAGEWLLHVPVNLNWFDGHFPKQPVLPGVVQIDWALHYAQQLGIEAHAFAGIPRVKFSAIIEPEAVLRLKLEKKSSGLRFLYESAGGVHSQGSISFA